MSPKEKDEDEVELKVVTDETSDDDKDEDTDEEGAAGGEAPAEDARLGASDEEAAEGEEAVRDRKAQRKTRGQRQREAREKDKARQAELDHENQFLRSHNKRLEEIAVENARRLDAIEGSTIETRAAQFKAAISKADAAIEEGVNSGDGKIVTEATRIRDDLRDGLKALENEVRTRQSADEDGGRRGRGPDPDIVAQAQTWGRTVPWFDFKRGDEDSAIAGAIDDTMMREGKYDPRTKAYWDEFDRRIAKRLPHRAKKGARKMNGNGHDEEDAGGEETPERRRPAGPAFRRGGPGRQLGANEVYLNKERQQAIEEAGFEPGSQGYKNMLKRYRDYDNAEQNKSAAR